MGPGRGRFIIDALMEVTRFDAEFALLAAVLLRTESVSSSQTENVTAGATALAIATLHGRERPGWACPGSCPAEAGRATQRLTVTISAGLLVDANAYFEALTEFRSDNAMPIVQRFTEAFWRT